MSKKLEFALPAYLPESISYELSDLLAPAHKVPRRVDVTAKRLARIGAPSNFVGAVLNSSLPGNAALLLTTLIYDDRLRQAWIKAKKLEEQSTSFIGGALFASSFAVFSHVAKAKAVQQKRVADFGKLEAALETALKIIQEHTPDDLLSGPRGASMYDSVVYDLCFLHPNSSSLLAEAQPGAVDFVELLRRVKENASVYPAFRNALIHDPSDYLLGKREGDGKQAFIRIFIGCFIAFSHAESLDKLAGEILPSFASVLYALNHPFAAPVTEDDVRMAMSAIQKAEKKCATDYAWVFELFAKPVIESPKTRPAK